MSESDDPETMSVGFWVSETSTGGFDDFDIADFERFEETMKREYEGTYSRSEHIRRALLLYLKVHERWAKLEEWDRPDGARALALQITSAMTDAYNEDVREADR